MRIAEVRDQEGVTTLREAWQTLQQGCPDLTPFQTWEWNEVWWRHFRARKRLCLLLFYASAPSTADVRAISSTSEQLVGIAPLYTSRHLGTPLRRLAWMGTGTSDYLGPLALPDYQEEAAKALLDYLHDGLRGWDMADLQHHRPDSPLLQQANSLACLSERTKSILPIEPCPYLPLPPTWDELAKGLGKKMRSNIGYYDRLLLRTFPDASSFLADAATLTEGMTALFALHQSRWNARWLPGVLGNRHVQAFHREIAECFLAQGWLRLHLLRVEGQIRSTLYCYALNGRTFYYLGGFAPELAKYSLGTLLTAHAIKHAISEGHTEFDFLRGDEPYKYRWLPQERINHRLLLLRTHRGLGGIGELPGRAGFALNRVERYIAHRARLFAEKQGRSNKEENRQEEPGKKQGKQEEIQQD